MVGFRENGLYGRQDIIRSREKGVGKRKEKVSQDCEAVLSARQILLTLAVWRGFW